MDATAVAVMVIALVVTVFSLILGVVVVAGQSVSLEPCGEATKAKVRRKHGRLFVKAAWRGCEAVVGAAFRKGRGSPPQLLIWPGTGSRGVQGAEN